ncbi:hypothetical protein GRI89_09385 [Altererythrobacter salegens]|uniref:Transmembrane protein n=1 Tax=Croceibacterium salegens TaxID=1737568 RepID=A0A6I4SX95_9SPHN|nr:hypothetical protein [Croceibacterium salegens]MXO59750.1 hypothetical protein [Croceibacterium salegens]
MDESNDEARRKDWTFQLNPPTIVCLFYLMTWFAGVTAIVGVILAYVFRRTESEESWERSHYDFHIRTFWMAAFGLSACIAGFFAMIFGVPDPDSDDWRLLAGMVACFGVGLLLVLLLLVRCAFALINAQRALPMPNPRTWWV